MSGWFREFLLILVGAGLGTVLGGGFGFFVGYLSPEFIGLMFRPDPVHYPLRLAGVLGMICGLILGTLAMIFALVVGTIREKMRTSSRIRLEND